MSVTSYPTLRLKLTMPQALKLQFLPAVPGSNAAAAAADAQAAADAAQAAANTAVAATANKVDKSGDVMTGFLTLNANPVANLQAATKQYVDSQVSAGGVPEAPNDGGLYGRQSLAWAAAQPLDADLTSLAAASATNQWYYRSAANTWSPVTVGATMTFVGGVLNTTAGGGNVIASGTPVSGQWARWTGAATIEGVDASATGFQPIDADLTSIAAATVTNQWLYRSAANTWSPVTIGANLTFTGGTLAATGGGGGAPVGAEYITSTADATLTAERVLTDTATVTWDRTTAGQIKANAAGGGGGASISISDTPPGSPTAGSLWWESDTGTLWIYYNDGNTSQWVAAAGGGGAAVGVIYGVRGLVGNATSTTAYAVTFLEATLRNSAGNAVLVTSGSFTADSAGAVGANGRDATLADGDLHLYAINGTSGNAGIWSNTAPPTGPTLPSGYTYWCYLTSVKRASSVIPAMRMRGNSVFYVTKISFVSASSVAFPTNLDVTPNVPAMASQMSLNVQAVCTAGSGALAQGTWNVGMGGAAAAADASLSLTCVTQAVSVSDWQNASVVIPLQNRNITAGWSNTSSILSVNGYVQILGYYVPNGS